MVDILKKTVKWMVLVLCPIVAFNIAYFVVSGKETPITPEVEKTSQIISAVETPKKNLYNILVLGEDEASGLADALLIVSCDTKSKVINILQIPRDTYAEYTSAAYRKINAASDVLGDGAAVAKFFEKNLGIIIDRYITVELETVGNTVDILGGVEIDVPMDMVYNDPYQGLSINIKKGRQTLNGEQAKQYVRYRNGYIRGDLDRLDAQKIFLSALVKKISEQSNLFSVLEIISTVLPKSKTDISYEYCFEIIKNIGIPDMNNICFVTLPGGDIQGSSGAWYYVMNRKAAYNIIKERFAPNISENEFDKDRKFTSNVRKGFEEIYGALVGYEAEIYSAYEMNGG